MDPAYFPEQIAQIKRILQRCNFFVSGSLKKRLPMVAETKYFMLQNAKYKLLKTRELGAVSVTFRRTLRRRRKCYTYMLQTLELGVIYGAKNVTPSRLPEAVGKSSQTRRQLIFENVR
jgi:hypothetical protein